MSVVGFNGIAAEDIKAGAAVVLHVDVQTGRSLVRLMRAAPPATPVLTEEDGTNWYVKAVDEPKCPHDQPGGDQFCIFCLRKDGDDARLVVAEMAALLGEIRANVAEPWWDMGRIDVLLERAEALQ